MNHNTEQYLYKENRFTVSNRTDRIGHLWVYFVPCLFCFHRVFYIYLSLRLFEKMNIKIHTTATTTTERTICAHFACLCLHIYLCVFVVSVSLSSVLFPFYSCPCFICLALELCFQNWEWFHFGSWNYGFCQHH